MADIESNIRIDIDTSSALASIKALQSQISQFQKEMSAASAATANNARNLQRQLVQDINATGQFSAGFRTIRSTTESFTNALEKNKLSMGEYFRFGASQVRGFRNIFASEFETIEKTARERVKTLQTQYISLGRDANGALQSIAVRPLSLDMNNLGTQTAMAAQRQQIFNQLLRQGSTNLLNFGKNTQWAGRQLMVGFTIPLSIFGSMASKSFMELEEQAIRFRRVYGELFTPSEETDAMIDQIKELASEFTKYGIAVESTLGLAADAAAMGAMGADLLAQTTEATRLAVLGGVDQQQALETTISLQNALAISSEDLAEAIDFLNAVENQTVTAIEDLTIAIPKAAPVIKQMGGDVKDLAFFLTAMKEGGINASEGANALKSGLASLINPTQEASDMLQMYGINIREIVEANRGDVAGLVVEFAQALDQLNPLQRARAIEQLFGKFQFARISTLFQNVISEGTQAQRVLELANATTSELAQLSSKELARVEESTTFKFRRAVEDFQAALAPVGEEFLKLITPLIEIGTKILEQFNNMSDGAKAFVTGLTGLLGGVLPIFLMTFGLIANGVANLIKGFAAVRNIFLSVRDGSNTLGQQIQYMTQEQLEAAAVAASLNQTHMNLTQTFTSETSAIQNLVSAYERMIASQSKLVGVRAIQPGVVTKTRKMKKGGVVTVPGSGKGDKVPAMLEPGEAVIPSEMTKKYAGLIEGMIAGNIPGYQDGRNIPVAGGFEASHFGPDIRIPIQEAIDMLRQFGKEGTQAFQNLIAAQKAGIQEVKAFNNQVVALPVELNKALGQTGSGKTVAAADVKRSISKVAPDMHIELESQLRQQGLSETEITKRIKRINDRIMKDLAKFDDSMQMTAEDVNGVIEKAYKAAEKVNGKVDEALQKANKAMETITTIKDPVDRDNPILGAGPGQDRVAAAAGSYRNKRRQYVRVASRGGQLGEHGAFRASEEMLSSLGMTHQQLANEVKNMTVAQQQSVATLAKAANKSKDYSQLSLKLEEIRSGASKRSKKAADDNMATANIEEQTSNKKRKAATKSKTAADKDAQSAQIESETSQRNRTTANIRARDPQTGRFIRGGSQAATAATIIPAQQAGKTTDQLVKMNNALQGSVFAITSLAGAASMMGGKVGEAAGKVFQLSGVLFALMQVTQLLTQASFLKLIADRKAIASQAMAFATYGKGIAAGTGFAGMLARGALGVAKFLGPVGLVVAGLTALGGIISLIIGAQKKQKENIEGLGNTAYLTAEKMKAAGELLGFTPSTTAFGQNIVAGTAAASGATQATAIQELRGNEQFQQQFAQQINAIRNATTEQAQRALQSLAIQQFGAGASVEAVDTLVKAIAQEAGRTDLNLSFSKINFETEEGIAQIGANATNAAQAFSQAFTDGLIRPMNVMMDGEQIFASFTGQGQQIAEQSAAQFASSFQALKDALANNLITADQFAAQIEIVNQNLSGLNQEQMNVLMPTLLEKLGLTETLEGITSVRDQILLLNADAAGIKISESMLEVLRGADQSPEAARAAARVRRVLIDRIRTQAKEQEELNKQIEEQTLLDEVVGAGLADIQSKTTELKNQRLAYEALTAAGYDAETAFELAGNAILAASVASAITAEDAADKMAEIKAGIDAFLAERALSIPDPRGGGGGSATKSPFQQAIEDLREQRTELRNATAAYDKLRQAGVGISEAFEAAQDPVLATALASTKVGTKQWKELVALIKQVDELARKNAIKDLLKEQAAARQLNAAFVTVAQTLGQMGLSAEEINDILSEPALAQEFIRDLEDGKLNSKLIRDYLNGIEKDKRIRIQIDMATPEGIQNEFERMFGEAMESFRIRRDRVEDDFEDRIKDAQDAIEATRDAIEEVQDEIEGIQTTISQKQREIEIEITRPIEEMQKVISGLQRDIEIEFDRPIAALQEEASDLSNDLALIDREVDQINDKYDSQLDALEDIATINEKIANQQKTQLDIADALSRGDIAAAARARQEQQKQQAQDNLENARQRIEAAKQAEIENVRSASGMTRLEIENRQFEISQQTYALEEQREVVQAQIRDIQDEIYILETLRELKLDAIRDLEDQIYGIQNGRLLQLQFELQDREDILEKINDEKQARLDAIALEEEAWTDAKLAFEEAMQRGKDYIQMLIDAIKLIQDLLKLTPTTPERVGGAAGTVGGGGGGGGTPSPAPAPSSTSSQSSALLPGSAPTGVALTSEKEINAALAANAKRVEAIDDTIKARSDQIKSLKASGGATNKAVADALQKKNAADAYTKSWELKAAAALKQTKAKVVAKNNVNTTTLAGVLKASGINRLANGGMIKRFVGGGFAMGTDTVPAMLTPGEFVVRKYAVDKFGVDNLKAINSGQMPSESVYNYSVNVNVKSDANPDQIAKAVMTQIKQIDSMRLRGNRF